MLAISGGSVFLAPVTVGGQLYRVVIDTGSSDPWLASKDFQCVDPTTDEFIDNEFCHFGPLYDKDASTTYEKLPDRSLNLSYHDGETLNGLMGREEFIMGGITVPEQEFGLVDYAAWYGDGISSGLIGFAYKTLTSMYAGENPKAAVPGKAFKYNTFFDNLWRSNTTAPVFSMALTRDPNLTGEGGILAVGGVPDIPYTPTMISVPILPVGVNRTSGETDYQFYTVVVDGFSISGDQGAQFASAADARRNPKKTALRGPLDPLNADNTQVNAIVDSGTTLVYVSEQLAAEVAAAFDPRGWVGEQTGLYEASCGAIPPIFGASIGGKVFNVNPEDLLLQYSADGCIIGVQSNHGGLWILGDVWMKAVLCVFDIGASRMGFAGRQFYGRSW